MITRQEIAFAASKLSEFLINFFFQIHGIGQWNNNIFYRYQIVGNIFWWFNRFILKNRSNQ